MDEKQRIWAIIIWIILIIVFGMVGYQEINNATNDIKKCEELRGTCGYYKCFSEIPNIVQVKTSYAVEYGNCLKEIELGIREK